MTIREITTALYFLPAMLFGLASWIAYDRMRTAINEKLPAIERIARWSFFKRDNSPIRITALYRRYYPCGNLARLYWVCYGFTLLSYAGVFICTWVIGKH